MSARVFSVIRTEQTSERIHLHNSRKLSTCSGISRCLVNTTTTYTFKLDNSDACNINVEDKPHSTVLGLFLVVW